MPSLLPAPLVFSQSSLAALDRCPRRFYLRHLRRLDWPAPLTGADAQWEAAMRRGQHFHLLVQQDRAGLEVAATVAAMEDAELAAWWQRYRDRAPELPPEAACHSEVEVWASLGRHLLVAKCDLVACGADGRVRIVDWKTGSRPPDLERLRHSWQTVVYRYAVVESGHGLRPPALRRAPLEPEQVELVYWHAAFATTEHVIPYTRAEHGAAAGQLMEAVARVESLGAEEAAYSRTGRLEECRRCPYRSYCERGRTPDPDPSWDEDEAEEEPPLPPESGVGP